ncbi:hypothetical protein MH117_25155 [Paenibacillus sp. ACRRX]|uniref:hypothetical protein n=1 Tax=Paenibacillus sp. ACRRX TaxID=2918206 RepID=UPI001EF55BBD|nr:hypothetical protein [Paenibacillus sp. ACRRX]MCG7410687.1 hypothetical protein [Paenibacillus sp. ACRRX]
MRPSLGFLVQQLANKKPEKAVVAGTEPAMVLQLRQVTVEKLVQYIFPQTCAVSLAWEQESDRHARVDLLDFIFH